MGKRRESTLTTGSLTDELDAAFREIDQLTEQWEQAKSYDRSLARVDFLSSYLEALNGDLRRTRSSMPKQTWSQMSKMLWRERPGALAAIGQALTADETTYMQIVSYLGFARGVLAAFGAIANDGNVPLASEP